MRNSPLYKEFEYLSCRHVDIDELIVGARSLLILIRPAIHLYKTFQRLTECEHNKKLILSLLVTLNCLCFLISSAFFALCSVAILLFFASLGYYHHKYNILVKVFPQPVTSSVSSDVTNGNQEVVEEFRFLLVIFDSFISSLNQGLIRFYSILKFEDVNKSLICYAAAVIWVLVLNLVPLHCSLTFLFDICILRRPLLIYFNNWKQQLTEEPLVPDSNSLIDKSLIQSDDAISQCSDNMIDPGFHTDSDNSELTEELSSGDDFIHVESVSIKSMPVNTSQHMTNSERAGSLGALSGSLGTESVRATSAVVVSKKPPVESLDSQSVKSLESSSASVGSAGSLEVGRGSINGSGSPGSGGRVQHVMGKIMELKQRRREQQKALNSSSTNTAAAVVEKCTACSVVFSTILKRKHACSNCGQYFCSRCCAYKVPRALFGATAPAAQTETVAVCQSCRDDLLNLNKNKKS